MRKTRFTTLQMTLNSSPNVHLQAPASLGLEARSRVADSFEEDQDSLVVQVLGRLQLDVIAILIERKSR